MTTFPVQLLTVREAVATGQGLRLLPGVRPSTLPTPDVLSRIRQGSPLELRLPNGTTRRTELRTYGIPVTKQPDGSLRFYGDLQDPEICCTLPSELTAEDVPPGTEVWLIDDLSS